MAPTRHTAICGLLVVFAVTLFAPLPSDLEFLLSWVEPTSIEEHVPHPIPKLMADAELKYQGLIQKQSGTLDEAVAEYRRRYKRDPPKGFDEWFEFASENDVKIVDEYDSLMNDLAPFWDIPGKELRRRAVQVGHLPSMDLVRLEKGKTTTLNVENGFNDTEVSARAKGFRMMIEKFKHKLPDMDFPINTKAEGRVLVPWEQKLYPNISASPGSLNEEEFVPDWRGDSNVWEEYRRTCDPSSPARRLFGSLRGQAAAGGSQRPLSYLQRRDAADIPQSILLRADEDLAFAERPDDTYDFCQNPWARFRQGHFFSDWRTLPVLYPVFSPAKAVGYSDILIPSHYYYSSTKKYTYGWDAENMVIKDVDDHEVPWDQKTNQIFWRGATTGGGSSPGGFTHLYQRHRFIEMAAGEAAGTRPVVFADPPRSDRFVTAEVPGKAMNAEFIDAAFTKAVGCAGFVSGCEGMISRYHFAESVPMGTHWKHKYLVDFDGMGYSARVMAFLASESAVIKATVYREFYSDWIQPWLHYIPLSQSYTEIYNIHAYFSGPSPSMLAAVNSSALNWNPRRPIHNVDNEGDRRLRRIARAGRQWKHTVARKVDMEGRIVFLLPALSNI